MTDPTHQEIDSIDDLFTFILDYFERHIMSPERFKLVMSIIAITQKGLLLEEIETIVPDLTLTGC